MKKINIIFLVLTLVFNSILNVQTLIARNRPPAPRGSGGFGDGTVVGGALDNYLIVLLVIALIFGSIIINKHSTNKV